MYHGGARQLDANIRPSPLMLPAPAEYVHECITLKHNTDFVDYLEVYNNLFYKQPLTIPRMGTKHKEKTKRRNSDKRKEQSRDAARNRRGKECEVFTALADQLPLTSLMTSQLDKASVMRLAISYIKLNNIPFTHEANAKTSDIKQEAPDMDHYYLRALDGFILVLDADAELVYLSENVSKYLGLCQVDMMGYSLYDFTHPCDHEEVRDMLSAHIEATSESECLLIVRLKCTLTSKGRNINFKSASYKVVRFSGRMVQVEQGSMSEKRNYYLLFGEPIPHPSNIEVMLDCKTFLSRHSMDMKFTYCDDRIGSLLQYDAAEMIGQSLYQFQHAQDSEMLDKAFKNLFSKGQSVTNRYRFLARQGGYAWVETQATLIYNNKTDKPQCIVCVHNVISEIQDEGLVLCDHQLEAVTEVKQEETASKTSTVKESCPLLSLNEDTMMSFFKPMTKEMEKPFYIPEGCVTTDLSHLAPTAGDGMMPIGETESSEVKIRLGDDLFDIEPDGENVEVIVKSNDTLCQDAFYEEEIEENVDYENSDDPGIHVSLSLPDMAEFMTDLSGVEADIDFNMRAPYIPMSGENDLIFGISPVLAMHNFDDDHRSCMGTTETVFTPQPEIEPGMKPVPLSILKQQIIGEQEPILVEGEVGKCPVKVKRAKETNRLETGPPAKQQRLTEVDRSTDSDINVQGKERRSSVLMNLLLKGEDRGRGYWPQMDEQVAASKQQEGFINQQRAQAGQNAQVPSGAGAADLNISASDPNISATDPNISAIVNSAAETLAKPSVTKTLCPPTSVITSGTTSFTAVTLDAATLEQLQLLIRETGTGPGTSVVIISPNGLCLMNTDSKT